MSKRNTTPLKVECYCNECGGNRERRMGNCYEVCAHYVMKHDNAYLIHGRITAPPEIGPVGHPVLDHAWCEVKGPFGIPMVWEPVNSKMTPKAIWDDRYKAEYHAIYDRDDAKRAMFLSGNYGPWEYDEDDDLEDTQQ